MCADKVTTSKLAEIARVAELPDGHALGAALDDGSLPASPVGHEDMLIRPEVKKYFQSALELRFNELPFPGGFTGCQTTFGPAPYGMTLTKKTHPLNGKKAGTPEIYAKYAQDNCCFAATARHCYTKDGKINSSGLQHWHKTILLRVGIPVMWDNEWDASTPFGSMNGKTTSQDDEMMKKAKELLKKQEEGTLKKEGKRDGGEGKLLPQLGSCTRKTLKRH